MPSPVFISYNQEDLATARDIRALLRRSGYRTWMAPDDISGALTWAEQIVEAIREAALLIVVLSEHSNQSKHVSREVDLAVELGVPLLPIRTEDVLPGGSLEYFLRLQQWADAFPGDIDEHADQILARVGALVPPADSRDPGSASNIEAAPLPLPPDTFIGREAALSEVIELLESSRLVTITGFGGSGKTRLSLELSKRIYSDSGKTPFFVELAEIDDPDLVPGYVASHWGVRNEDRRVDANPFEMIGSGDVLIVLDNCEHLIEAAARFASDLVEKTPKARVLATSREPLRVSGEMVYQLAPLPAPPSQFSDLDRADAFAGVRLFIERARESDPALDLGPQSLVPICSIVSKLDGLPLAIELAASRVRAFGLRDIDAMLDKRVATLRDGRRSAAPRHQSLEAAIDWSYDTLDRDEKSCFERLSLMVGSFGLGAAKATSDDGSLSGDAAVIVASLVDKSLLIPISTQDNTARYRMLQILREYGMERLIAKNEYEATAARFVRYWAMACEEAEVSLLANREEAPLRRLAADHPNVRRALELTLESGDAEIGRLASGLALIWILAGLWVEGRHWLERTWSKKGPDASTTHLRLDLRTISEIADPTDALVFRAGSLLATDPQHAARLLGAASLLQDMFDDHSPGTAVLQTTIAAQKELGQHEYSQALSQGYDALGALLPKGSE